MDLLSSAGIYAGTFLLCAISGIVPLVNSELVMLYLGSTASLSQFPALILLATIGQLSATVVLHSAGRGVLKLPLGRGQARIEALRVRLSTRSHATRGLTFVSALTGLPSFYATSVAAGTLGWPLSRFLLWGGAGRVLHYSAVLLLPGLLKALM